MPLICPKSFGGTFGDVSARNLGGTVKQAGHLAQRLLGRGQCMVFDTPLPTAKPTGHGEFRLV